MTDDTKPSTDNGTESMFGYSIPGLTLINSKPRGGKSHMIHASVYSCRDQIDWIVAFTNTGHNEDNLTFMGDKDFVWPQYSSEVMKNILEEQQNSTASVGCIIVDDLPADKEIWKCPYFLQAISTTHHSRLWIIIATHCIQKVPVTVRENAFQVAIFKVETKRAFIAAYESYGQDFETYPEFHTFMNKYTGNYKFLFKDIKGEKPWRCLICEPTKPVFTFAYCANTQRCK